VNKCQENESPIFVAARNGHANCITQLIAARGDVNKGIRRRENTGRKDSQGDDIYITVDVSPIDIAMERRHLNIAQQLRQAR
jgi:ankyrin repeat protein